MKPSAVKGAAATGGGVRPSWLAWLPLALLAAWWIAGALLDPRADWPNLAEGEATVLMQAKSVLVDGDVRYQRLDFDRQVLDRYGEPPDLALRTAAIGQYIVYDRPIAYAAWLAPFLSFRPLDGFVLANVLLLLGAAVWTARSLGRHLGEGAPLWTPLWATILLVGSAVLPAVAQATGAAFGFGLSLAAAAALLSVDLPGGKSGGGDSGSGDSGKAAAGAPVPTGCLASIGRLLTDRAMLAGALLGVGVAGAFYTERGGPLAWVPLLVAFAYLPAWRARWRVLGGAIGSCAFLLFVGFATGAGWPALSDASNAFRFTPETGFPLVDFADLEWTAMVNRFEALYFTGAADPSWSREPLLWFWNAVYLLVGESIGLLPYFPCLLLLVLAPARRGAKVWVAGFAVWTVLVLWFHPFDLANSRTAFANQRFLPLYGLLPLALGRPLGLDSRVGGWLSRWPAFDRLRRRRGALAVGLAALVIALGAPFLHGVWSAPWSPPAGVAAQSIGALGGGAPAAPAAEGSSAAEAAGAAPTPIAQALLPYETSQQSLAGGPTEAVGLLTVRFLNQTAWHERGRERLVMERDQVVDLLVASAEPLDVLRLDFGEDAPAAIDLETGSLGERVLRPTGGISYRVLPGFARRHAMWWGPRRQSLYRLRFSFPAAETVSEAQSSLAFRLRGERVDRDGAATAADPANDAAADPAAADPAAEPQVPLFEP